MIVINRLSQMNLDQFKKEGWYCILDIGRQRHDTVLDGALVKHMRDAFKAAKGNLIYDRKKGTPYNFEK